jgi:hypothetical protein
MAIEPHSLAQRLRSELEKFQLCDGEQPIAIPNDANGFLHFSLFFPSYEYAFCQESEDCGAVRTRGKAVHNVIVSARSSQSYSEIFVRSYSVDLFFDQIDVYRPIMP